MFPSAVLWLLVLLPVTSWSQTQDSTVSPAPGGVPVPSVPMQRSSAAATAEVPASASVFRVRVVDGRNGLAMDHAHLQLWYDERGTDGTTLLTNAQGVALMPAPVGTPVRVLVFPQDAIDCTRSQKDQNAPAEAYNLATLAATGTASVNHCGHVAIKPKPGELILFARPVRWYEGINR